MMKMNDNTRQTTVQLLKYAVIGASNTIITLVAFYVLNTLLGFPYGAANVAGYVLGVVNSFVWNRTWVFKSGNNVRREALLFVCGFLLCMMLQGIVSWVLLEPLGMKSLPDDVIPFLPMKHAGQNIVMVVAMGVYTVANYVYNRMVTFKSAGAVNDGDEEINA